MRHFLRSRLVLVGALLALAAAVDACDLSPQPLPPAGAGGATGEPRAGSGSTTMTGSSGNAASEDAASPDAASQGPGGSGSLGGASSGGSASGSAPVGVGALDAGGVDATAGPDASIGSDAGRGEDGGDARSGDAATDGGLSPDGGTPPDGGTTDAGCDSGCYRQRSATNCQAPKVEWYCPSSFDQSALESACGSALATDSIRYCCPADFRQQCP